MPQAAAARRSPQFVKTAVRLLGDNGHKPRGNRAATTLAVHETRVEVDAIARVEREFFVLDGDDDRALEHQVELLTAVVHELCGLIRRILRDKLSLNGHLEEPWVYLVLWLLLMAIAVSMIGTLTYLLLHVPPSEKLQTVQTAFRAGEVKSEELYLAAVSPEGTYCLERYDLYENLPEPSFFCSGKTFTVGTYSDSRDILLLLGEDGTEYVTPELWLRAYQKESLIPFVLLMLFCAFGFAFSCFGIAVTRHPERYSPRFRRLFYQEGVLINVDEPESTKNTPPRPADHNKRKGRYRL